VEQGLVGSHAAISSRPLKAGSSWLLCRSGLSVAVPFLSSVHFPFPAVAQDSGTHAQRCQRRPSLPPFPKFPEEPKKKKSLTDMDLRVGGSNRIRSARRNGNPQPHRAGLRLNDADAAAVSTPGQCAKLVRIRLRSAFLAREDNRSFHRERRCRERAGGSDFSTKAPTTARKP